MANAAVGAKQVGEFNTVNARKILRSTKNPLDKATIVNICPIPVYHRNWTMQPGEFFLDAGSVENPSILVVSPSSYFKEQGENQPLLEISNSAVMMANSIVSDWMGGLLACDKVTKAPGLFFVVGEETQLSIKTKYRKSIEEAEKKQKAWFVELIKIADSLWARGNGNPLIIWDIQRTAAKMLGLDDKPWLKNMTQTEMEKCFACGALKNPDFPVCGVCRVIDQNHPKAKDLKFAV